MTSHLHTILLAATLAYLAFLGGLPAALLICTYLLFRPSIESSLNPTTEFLVVLAVGVSLAAIAQLTPAP